MERTVSALAFTAVAAAGLVGAGPLGASSALAEYDNPMMGDTACVVLTRYIADEPTGRHMVGGSEVHRAEVGVANICGRSVEVSLCVGHIEPVDGVEETCFSGFLRPWSSTEVHTVEAPVPLTGPVIEWRWVSRDAGM